MSKSYGAFSKEQRHKLIEEALDLIVTYFGQNSDIFVHTSERSLGYYPVDLENLQYFQTRFILAKWITFKEIIGTLDSILSSSYEPIKEEFIGKIQGTLLISEYVTKKWNNIQERRYPCLISSENFDTPENAFIFNVLTFLEHQLRRLPLPVLSSEYGLRQKALSDCSNMRQHPVFQVVRTSSYLKMKPLQLLSLIKTRNRRGQTGNVKKFTSLIKWFESLDWSSLIDDGPEKLDLVFGSSPNIWDKFFEVWVLAKLLKSLQGKGIDLFSSAELKMIPLDQRGSGPTATIKTADTEMEIYFQNSILFKSRWKYFNGGSLRGIPDILISVKGDPNILIIIDVKNVMYQARKDGNTEKYKMLGYFESYRASLKHQPVGILIMRNDESFFSDFLYTEEQAKLFLCTVSPSFSDEGFSFLASTVWELADNPPAAVSAVPQSRDEEVEETLITRQEEAHSLANALALNRPEELLRCKKELQRNIFPTTWDLLPVECQTLLGMAELLYQNLEEQCGTNSDVDWGPVVLEYCRAVEYFFNHELIMPFKESTQFKEALTKTGYLDKLAYGYLAERNTFMFGELSRFFRDLRNSSGGIFTYINTKENLNSDIVFWKRYLSNLLYGINIDYRRKSAHIDLLSAKDASVCRQRIMGSAENKGLFPNLLNIRI